MESGYDISIVPLIFGQRTSRTSFLILLHWTVETSKLHTSGIITTVSLPFPVPARMLYSPDDRSSVSP